MRSGGSVDGEVYAMPSPVAVARLVDSHGADAAMQRWHWLGARTISALAQKGRAQAGDVAPRRTGGQPMSCTEADAAVAIEAAYALGSAKRGVRAAGVSVGAQALFSRRGLTPPTISSEGRGVATSLGARAKRGDTAAAAAWQSRIAHERAVGSVIRTALALVAEQPAAGRYVLPPQDAVLADALRGEDPDAISVVFPELPLLSSEPTDPEPDVHQKPSAARRAFLPDSETMRALHAEGLSCVAVASRYGGTAKAVYVRWSRLGLDTRGRCGGMPKAPAPQVDRGGAPPPEAVASAEPTPRPWRPGTDYADVVVPGAPGERLSIEDLTLAADLTLRRRLSPEKAVALVRADVAAARDAATETTHNGVPESAIHAWLDALANGRHLPDLKPREACRG